MSGRMFYIRDQDGTPVTAVTITQLQDGDAADELTDHAVESLERAFPEDAVTDAHE